MKIAVMQPYLFPYLGYFQLIASVDVFVYYDDVNYIKGGWINRNRLLLNDAPFYFTVPCQQASPNKLICDIDTALNEKQGRKLLFLFSQSYARAPYVKQVMPILEDVFSTYNANLSEFTIKSIMSVCEYLGIEKEWRVSSKQDYNSDLPREQRLIDICKTEGCNVYHNPIGGQELYTKEMFSPSGIELKFVKNHLPTYTQRKNEFVPGLSIIDILMFNDKKTVLQMMEQYELI